MRHSLALLTVLFLAAGFVSNVAAQSPVAEINPQTSGIEIADPVWVEDNYDIHYVVDPGKNSTIHQVTIHPADDLRPRLTILPNGDAWLAWWRDETIPEVRVRRFEYATGTWSAEAALSDPSTGSVNPVISHDLSGVWVAFEAEDAGETAIVVGMLEEDPDPFGACDPMNVASTTYDGDHDLQLHTAGGHVWVSWIDSEDEVGYAEFDHASATWDAPGYEPYTVRSVTEAITTIRQQILGD